SGEREQNARICEGERPPLACDHDRAGLRFAVRRPAAWVRYRAAKFAPVRCGSLALARVERQRNPWRCFVDRATRLSLAFNPATHGVTPFLLPPLSPQLRPIFEPLPDLALEAAFGRVVEARPAQLLGEIVLAGKCIRHVVIVFIARAVALSLHQLGRCVEDVLGW